MLPVSLALPLPSQPRPVLTLFEPQFLHLLNGVPSQWATRELTQRMLSAGHDVHRQ